MRDPMKPETGIPFFDRQFARQLRDGDLALNPFERQALPYLRGRVLDYGCGLGNLALAAARQGCTVVALDGSAVAIRHVRDVARAESLAVQASVADLRDHPLRGAFDAVVSIGLLMFFDCPTALARLADLQAHVKPGGVAVVNVLVEGTTYLDMFDPSEHCLFARDGLERRFEGWEILCAEHSNFAAANGQLKSFATIIARKPPAPAA